MRIALAELRRQPGRFLPVGGALTFLVILLVVLGGFLDGLELGQTGALRAQDPGVVVVADDVELQLTRSRLPAGTADDVAAVDGVGQVGRLDQLPTTASADRTARGDEAADEGADELEDVVLFGYDVATDLLPDPPPDGAIVDTALADRVDLAVGDTLLIGPRALPLQVVELVDDLSQGAPTVWVSGDRWRELVGAGNPGAVPPEGASQALVALPDPDDDRTGDDPGATLAEAVTDAVDGAVAATSATAIEALPVVQQQSATFQGIIGVTFAVTLLVVALFFALITLERTELYAVLKALGARNGDLLTGLTAQAVGISLGALVLGIAASIAFVALLPPELPIRLVPSRLATIAVGTVVTAVLGSLLTLRRITAIDPADSIG